MALLAIKGHKTRGNEVIEILEMLGGKTRYDRLSGNESFSWYYINGNGCIDYTHYSVLDNAIFFTLEEFLEKFPYKIGDKVCYIPLSYNYTIIGMRWSDKFNEVYYKLSEDDCFELDDVSVKQLSNCKEKGKEIPPYMDYPVRTEETVEIPEKLKPVIDLSQHSKDEYIIKLGDYEIKEVDGILKAVRKKQKYPKTYEECCRELGYNQIMPKDHILGYMGTLLSAFQQLLICRDAYWKIAGDWKFDFDKSCYYLYNEYDSVQKFSGTIDCNAILTFPTEEMRDAFYENFKELIESCKEFL